MNIVVLVGRLTKEPELRYIASTGTPVLSFTLAVDREFSTKKEADFINCELYGKSAESCSNVLTKGFRCGVQGSLRIENYQDGEGNKKTATKVRAVRVEYLDKKSETGTTNNFNPQTLEPQGFQTIDDDDLPF